MWTKTYSKLYKGIQKEDIWRLWKDVNNWTQWHDDLEYCKMEGEFEEGNYFWLKPKGAPKVKIKLVYIDSGVQFTDCSYFFGAKMYDTHSLEESEKGLIIKNEIIVKGPLKKLWIKLVAEKVALSIPKKIEALVKLARWANV